MKKPAAIVLAGGLGTRLKSEVPDVPKPMAPVNGKPFLEYVLARISAAGIKQCVMSVGHMHQKIMDYFGPLYLDTKLTYAIETEPMGTGGGVRMAAGLTSAETLLVLNGDTFFDIDLAGFISAHEKSGRPFSMALRNVEDASRYGIVKTDKEGLITGFTEKSQHAAPGLINAGVYILNKELYMANTEAGTTFSIERDFFEAYCNRLPVTGHIYDGYFIDIGIPADYKRARHELKRFED